MPSDIRQELGLRQVINVSGTMTSLGASIVTAEAITAMSRILPQFIEIEDLQRRACATIARVCAAQAGCVTASASAGMTLTIAGAMTGLDFAAIERLPDTTGLKNEVVVQMGHLCSYGAPIDQAIRLAGAKPIVVGQSTSALRYQLEGAITERSAAALYVVSHHVVEYGQIPLEEFCTVAQARGVPVIVDAASEYDLTGFLARGADVAIYSGHKFLGGPTSGIVAGRKDLVRAAYAQNIGIGRGMKVGKESILGAMAALDAWTRRDHAAVRRREREALDLWQAALAGRPGIRATIVPDPTHNPLDRLRVDVVPAEAHITAWAFADALASGDPPVIVRDHEIEQGWLQLDPCNLHPGQGQVVANRLIEELDRALRSNQIIDASIEKRRNRHIEGLSRWPD
jgi:D-glucosaminate-6-phosphate ammonia-lyase